MQNHTAMRQKRQARQRWVFIYQVWERAWNQAKKSEIWLEKVYQDGYIEALQSDAANEEIDRKAKHMTAIVRRQAEELELHLACGFSLRDFDKALHFLPILSKALQTLYHERDQRCIEHAKSTEAYKTALAQYEKASEHECKWAFLRYMTELDMMRLYSNAYQKSTLWGLIQSAL